MIKVETTSLNRVLVIHPESFEDHRGEYVETYCERDYFKSCIDIKFVQDDYSVSNQNVLRGLHGDDKTWKLIYCPYGKFYLVVLDYNESSETYGKWLSFVLSDRNKKQVLIPPNYANGHLILSEKAIFGYKQSCYYEPNGQFTVKYNDPRFNIWWPIKNPMLSIRDELAG